MTLKVAVPTHVGVPNHITMPAVTHFTFTETSGNITDTVSGLVLIPDITYQGGSGLPLGSITYNNPGITIAGNAGFDRFLFDITQHDLLPTDCVEVTWDATVTYTYGFLSFFMTDSNATITSYQLSATYSDGKLYIVLIVDGMVFHPENFKVSVAINPLGRHTYGFLWTRNPGRLEVWMDHVSIASVDLGVVMTGFKQADTFYISNPGSNSSIFTMHDLMFFKGPIGHYGVPTHIVAP